MLQYKYCGDRIYFLSIFHPYFIVDINTVLSYWHHMHPCIQGQGSQACFFPLVWQYSIALTDFFWSDI